MEKTVITVAAGKKLYVEYATNLAMSFLYWNTTSEIKFTLITDLSQYIPSKIAKRINVIAVESNEIGEGFSSKLVLNKYLNNGQNLFIDADCLIYGRLEPVFEKLKGNMATVIGHAITDGLGIGFCKDITRLLKRLELSYYPMFCGSVYYFEKQVEISCFFDYAKSLLPQYDALDLIRLRNKENEEPLIGLAMSKFNQHPVPDDGSIKADRMYFDYCSNNVLTGKSKLWVKKSPKNPTYCKLQFSNPTIIHYNARSTDAYEYIADARRLRFHVLYGGNKHLFDFFITFFYENPSAYLLYLYYMLKASFRPISQKIFGVRKVKPSKRLFNTPS